MNKFTNVYLVRHGEAEPKIRGVVNKDPKLTRKGVSQAKRLGKQLVHRENISSIYISNLSRSIETGEIINKQIETKLIQKEDFRELNRYFFERKFWTKRWWKYYFSYKKACNLFDRILKENKGKDICLIIHGRRIISFVGYKLGLSIKQMEKMISMGNCHTSKLIFEGTKLEKVKYLNSPDIY